MIAATAEAKIVWAVECEAGISLTVAATSEAAATECAEDLAECTSGGTLADRIQYHMDEIHVRPATAADVSWVKSMRGYVPNAPLGTGPCWGEPYGED